MTGVAMAISQIVRGGDRAEMPSIRTLARRSWWLLAAFGIVGMLAGTAYGVGTKNSFGSTVQVQITPTVDVHAGVQPSKQLVNLDTETAVIRSDAVLQDFAKRDGLTLTPEELRKNVKVAPVADFGATTPSPRKLARRRR
jgi:uncharacterized protein involved in exopolysaccharide biosynthesis